MSRRRPKRSGCQCKGKEEGRLALLYFLLFILRGKVFFIDEPTRGVDVGAKAEIQRMVRELAAQGSSCLVVSSEIEELSAVCDRVVILNRGKLTGELLKKEIDKDTLMHLCV